MKTVMCSVLPFISILIFFISIPSCLSLNHASSILTPSGFSAKIINRNSIQSPFCNPNLTRFDRIQASIGRQQALSSTNASLNYIDTKLRHTDSEYIMEYYIGTPPVLTYGILDTGSSLTWLQCLPCEKCYKQTKVPIFNPAKSSTYRLLSCKDNRCSTMVRSRRCKGNAKCQYAMFYKDGSDSVGDVAQETLTFLAGAKYFTAPNIVFGCGHKNVYHDAPEGIPGLIGLTREPASIVTQLSYKQFAYCFGDYDKLEKSGYARFGSAAYITGDKTPMQFVNYHPFFYLSLEGISLDHTRLPIPNDAFTIKNKYPRGGFIIDSGTNFSQLNKTAFDILVDSLKQRIKNVRRASEVEKRIGFSLCYELQWQDLMFIPVLTFHFTGANLYLPKFNTWLKIKGDIHCLAILPTDGRSKLGNFQQQNFNVGYNLENKLVSFNLNYCSDLD